MRMRKCKHSMWKIATKNQQTQDKDHLQYKWVIRGLNGRRLNCPQGVISKLISKVISHWELQNLAFIFYIGFARVQTTYQSEYYTVHQAIFLNPRTNKQNTVYCIIGVQHDPQQPNYPQWFYEFSWHAGKICISSYFWEYNIIPELVLLQWYSAFSCTLI